jgi:energy-coupling factor transporter ATP-binding protein EcfA2
MIECIEFKNFKALRKTTLGLTPFTLLLGPNGSGKSTVLQALQSVKYVDPQPYESMLSVGVAPEPDSGLIPIPETPGAVQILLKWKLDGQTATTRVIWIGNRSERKHLDGQGQELTPPASTRMDELVGGTRIFYLEASAIAAPVHLQPNAEMADNGADFPGVLERLRDEDPERFEALNKEVGHWLPEFDRILFDTPSPGQKAFALRTRLGKHKIPAWQLSQGTLLSIAMLTLAHLPSPPVFVGLEEPDRGLHPRLLRHLRDAMYRLSYPESCGELRPAVQVLATTHSPYLLDLYRDHPEEVVLARKVGLNVQFERLSERPDFEEILGDAPLSEAWYSGILGGVPAES